jgi:hypothetical protein
MKTKKKTPPPKNPAAVALGRMAAGKPKTFSAADRRRRADLCRTLAARIGRAKPKNRKR